jgi:hypothetical protein
MLWSAKAVGEAKGHHVQALKGAIAEAQQNGRKRQLRPDGGP